MIADVVTRWHAFIRGELPGGLDELLDDDVVFYSPIVFTPQRGKQITALYLQAAAQTFGGDEPDSDGPDREDAENRGHFHYTKTVLGGDTAMLEFETTMKGKYVNGVDITRQPRPSADGRDVGFDRPTGLSRSPNAVLLALLRSREVGDHQWAGQRVRRSGWTHHVVLQIADAHAAVA